jgi:hypothetical protein
MGCLLGDLGSDYSEEPAYRVLQRVFQEHFTVDDASLRPEVLVQKQLGFVTALPVNHHRKRAAIPQQVQRRERTECQQLAVTR